MRICAIWTKTFLEHQRKVISMRRRGTGDNADLSANGPMAMNVFGPVCDPPEWVDRVADMVEEEERLQRMESSRSQKERRQTLTTYLTTRYMTRMQQRREKMEAQTQTGLRLQRERDVTSFHLQLQDMCSRSCPPCFSRGLAKMRKQGQERSRPTWLCGCKGTCLYVPRDTFERF